MPIIIDETQDMDTQIVEANARIASRKQVDAKYYSKSMTGNGKRKAGLFGLDADNINDFLKEKRRLLDNVQLNEAYNKSQDRHDNQVFGNFFHQSTRHKEEHFKKFENNLTSLVPPILIEKVISSDYKTALSFKRYTGMYNLNAIESIWTKVTSGTIDGQPATTYTLPVVQSMRLYAREKTVQGKTGAIGKESTVVAQPEIYVLFATVLDDMDKHGDMIFTNHVKKNVNERQGVVSLVPLLEKSRVEYDYELLAENLENHVLNTIDRANMNMPLVGAHELSLLVGDQSLYETLTRQAMTTTHQSDEILMSFIETFTKRSNELKAKSGKYDSSLPTMLDNSLITFTQHLDTFNDLEDDLISTDMLASIYEALKGGLEDQLAINKIARHSLRLLLSQRLFELDDIKKNDGLYRFEPTNAQAITDMQQNPNYSVQQKRIITTTDPLVIGQAGAGSGKSHTLIGRMEFLKEHGEDLKKVLVLSFTNVAAINISQRMPGVRSETLANMFHTIYSATFPAQALSQPSTVANSIRLLNPASDYFKNLGINERVLEEFISEFAVRLEQFDQTGFKRVNLQQELKRMSNLIENNLALVSYILDAVEQTTLELEPIIIHHMLLNGGDKLNIPQDYQDLNYIITDESQDISTFEYILLLELTLHYRSQLCIIGDGSQTLYEFRNSDPRYMNALESSNVFTSHKLETNYRSNEEILMFANQFLKVIDANKYANIQLKSSSYHTPSVKTLKEAITISDNEVSRGSTKEYTEGLKTFLQEDDDFQEWFLDRVRKGEQIAFMGWTRKEVLDTGEVLEQLLNDNGLGHIQITNIMSDNKRPMTLLSRFARVKSQTLRSLDPSNVNYLQEVERHADEFVFKNFPRSTPKQKSFYEDYIMRAVKEITGGYDWRAWTNDFVAGRISSYQIGSFLLQALLRAETRKNRMEQFINKQKEVPNYDECPIILSTIHGTKGLEFDHTVVMYNESKRGATTQESMRMMFVALSRAKKSQFIINSYAPSAVRAVSNTLSSMFQTPMSTAFLLTENDVKALQKP